MSFKVHSYYLVRVSINVHYCIHPDKHCSRDRIHIQFIACLFYFALKMRKKNYIVQTHITMILWIMLEFLITYFLIKVNIFILIVMRTSS